MAIFNNGDNAGSSTGKTSGNTTIITEGAALKGEMNVSCDIYIDGQFEGGIHSQHLVTVGKNGKVKGELFASRLIVQGYVEGNVDVDRVEIKEAGRVSGTITSTELIIEAKGHFQGESRIKGENTKKTDPVKGTVPPKEDVKV